MYDSREDLVTRLTAIRAAITKARSVQAYGTGDASVTRANLRELLQEEKDVLQRIDVIDASLSGGACNLVQFNRPQ